MIDKPLYQNPLGGGLGNYGSILPNPGGITPRGGAQNVDPIMQGFQDSEFRKNANMMQQDAVNFKYKGQDMMMNGSMSAAFKQYLDSIGQGNLYEPEIQLGSAKPGVNPIVSDPSSAIASINGPGLLEGPPVFATPGLPPQEEYDPDKYADFAQKAQIKGPEDTLFGVENNPFNRVGQQLTSPDQNNNIIEILKNIEQGIASLGLNYEQGNNMNQSSNYGNFDNFGIGSFFPPYGGMYG